MKAIINFIFTLSVVVSACAQPGAVKEKSQNIKKQTKNMNTETITLGNGCFWCTEAVFQQVKGVSKVTSGYSGGHVENPTYEQVCGKQTGHAEVLQIEFDPSEITVDELLEIFWQTHDPTTLNKQGNDEGPQYRSVIFYHNENQKQGQNISRNNWMKARPSPIRSLLQ